MSKSTTRTELRARPVLQYVVTEYTCILDEYGNITNQGVVTLGTFANAAQANVAANKFAGVPSHDEHTIVVEECDQYKLDWSRAPGCKDRIAWHLHNEHK